jgi:hypothetical protein
MSFPEAKALIKIIIGNMVKANQTPQVNLDTPFHKKIRHTGSKKKDSMLSIDLPVK